MPTKTFKNKIIPFVRYGDGKLTTFAVVSFLTCLEDIWQIIQEFNDAVTSWMKDTKAGDCSHD